MRWGEEMDEAFPPRHPREPGGLRQDILDEIADHLECAAKREAERGGENDTEESAWGRVLERFGNPDAIARKLWWDEMRDTVMREWIQTAVVVVVAVAVVVFMALVMRQMNTANQAVVEALKSNATAVNPLVTLKVKVTRGTEDGPPAEGVEIRLMGAAFGNEVVHITRSTDATGVANFGPMQAGQFEAFATDPTSDLSFDGSKVVTLFAGSAPEVVKLVAPDVLPRDVSLDFSSPVVLGENRGLSGSVFAKWEMDGATWTDHARFSLDAEPAGGSDQRVARTAEKTSLRISGEITGVELQLSKPGNLQDNASLDLSQISPLQDGSGYRLELPPVFVKQFDDWRVQDHAKARGVELEERLLAEVRTQFPTHLVESASLIDETFWAFQSGVNLFGMVAGSSQEGRDIMKISSVLQQSYGRFSGDGSSVALFSAPVAESLEVPSNSRVVLATAFKKFTPMEPENELQVWSIFNDALKSMSTVVGPNPAGFAPEFGAEPAAAHSIVELAELGERSNWLLFDVTTGLTENGAGGKPQAFMMRWSHDESRYSSFLELIGSKNADFRQLRPMWLVLKPMNVAEEVAAAQ